MNIKQIRFLSFIVFLLIFGCSGISKNESTKVCNEIMDCTRLIHLKVERNWKKPLIISSNLRTTIKIEIGKNNNLVRVVVLESSGNKGFDDTVIKAIHDSAPFNMLAGLSPSDRERFNTVSFVFDHQI